MDEELSLPRILGRYVLLGDLASGGMGTIYLARLNGDLGFGRTVAVKRLHPALAADPRFVADFLKEGRVAARIRHPNVIPTLDVIASGDDLAIVMEYVDCITLGTLKRQLREVGESIPIPIAAAMMAQVLTGLHAAHETTDEDGAPLGIVHRDVSGQNVLLGLDGVARVADFGVAKVADEHSEVTGFKGKLHCTAPEQLESGYVDRRADIWAAGVLLWETVVGRRLFYGEPHEIICKIMDHDVPPPSRYVPAVPPEIESVILRALSADPEERFGSALEMAAELERAVTRLPTTREIAEWLRGALGPEIDEALRKVRGLEQHARALEAGSGAEEAETITYSDSSEEPPPVYLDDLTATTAAYVQPPMPAQSTVRPVTAAPDPRAPSWNDGSLHASWARGNEPSGKHPKKRRAALVSLGAMLGAVIAFVVGIAQQPNTPHAAAPPPPPAVEEIPIAPPPPVVHEQSAPPPSLGRAHPRTRASCNAPWIIDANGVRVPKPDC